MTFLSHSIITSIVLHHFFLFFFYRSRSIELTVPNNGAQKYTSIEHQYMPMYFKS